MMSGARTRRAGRRLAAVGVTALLAAAAAGCGGGDFEKTAEGFNIEPASEVGPNAFTPSVAREDVENALGVGVVEGELAAASDSQACDKERFLKELQERPEAMREWARVLGLSQAEVPAYVRSLESTVLPEDTKVTNHGLRDGRAYARASVLTAGTAVLVEPDGSDITADKADSSMPPATGPTGGKIVTRCKCGNPLLPPVEDPKTIEDEPEVPEVPGTDTSLPGSIPPASRTSTTSDSDSESESESNTTRSTTVTTRSTTTSSRGSTTTAASGDGDESGAGAGADSGETP